MKILDKIQTFTNGLWTLCPDGCKRLNKKGRLVAVAVIICATIIVYEFLR